MKIIPLHSAEPTFLRLSRFEWGVSLFFALLVPMFIQATLACFSILTSVPLCIGMIVVSVADSLIVYAKSKEQDFLTTWIGNSRIPDSIIGVHPVPYGPILPIKDPKEENP